MTVVHRGERMTERQVDPLPAVDVVIPFCPVDAHWLPEAVASIQRQNFAETVIHLINDGVPDEYDTSRQYAQLSNLRRYRNADAPIGPYRSLMRIVDALETPWIVIHDADDISLPMRVHATLERMREQRAVICAGGMENFLDPGSAESRQVCDRINRRPTIHSTVMESPDKTGQLINGAAVIARWAFEALNGFADWRCGADNEFYERAQFAGFRAAAVPRIVGLRRMHAQSLSNGALRGHDSETRQRYLDELKRRRSLWEAACDPRTFGALEQHRGNPLTVRLDAEAPCSDQSARLTSTAR